MAASVTLPLGGEVKAFSKSNTSEGRPVFEYEDGKRTEKPVTDDQGRALYRHAVLVAVSDESDPEEAALMLPTAAPTGPRFAEVKLAPGATVRISARSQEGSRFAELAFQITGELAAASTPKKTDGSF